MPEETQSPTDAPAPAASGAEETAATQPPTPPTGAAPAEPAGPDLSVLLQKLSEAQAAAEEQRNRHLRVAADFENYRRRSIRDREEARAQAEINLLQDLLPVLDSLALGLESSRQHHPEAAVVIDGFAMVQANFLQALGQRGVKELRPEGEDFDPHRHECVAHLPSPTVAEGKVMTVTRTGYLLGERLLRPAGVVVSSGPAPTASAPAAPAGADSNPA